MTENKKSKIFRQNGGCKEDCMNCKYPDCYKPVRNLKTDVFVKQALKTVRESESNPMYTTVLKRYARVW